MSGQILISRTYCIEPFVLLLGEYDGRLCLCSWIGGRVHSRTVAALTRRLGVSLVEGSSALLDMAAGQLDEYFASERREFDIPLMPVGTEFQMQIWRALLDVPYGSTASYKTLARAIGRPTATRAVANANRANPLSIFIPCHRIVGSNGSLTGYGGGLPAKRFLLDLEHGPVLPL